MGKAYHEGHILHSGSILTQESSSYFLYSLNWDGVIRIKKVEILLMEFQVEFGLVTWMDGFESWNSWIRLTALKKKRESKGPSPTY